MLTMFAYLMIMLCFGGFMVISFLVGGGDHDVHHEVLPADGHDVGHDASHGHGDKQSGILQGWLSLKVIAAFGTAFGAAGSIAQANGLGDSSIWVAVGSGLVIAAIIRILIRGLRGSESDSSFTRSQVVGKEGTVTLPIVGGSTGEAQFSVSGELVALPVRSEDGRSIPQGSRVAAVSAGAVMVVKSM